MTRKILLNIPAYVEIEGKSVFELLEKKQAYTSYNVIGFHKPKIEIKDYRKQGLEAIDNVIQYGDFKNFPTKFCFPSYVRIHQEDEHAIFIELSDLEEEVTPKLMLWIATDLQEPIPDYQYVFSRIASLTDSSSFVSIFNYHRFWKYFEGDDFDEAQTRVENQKMSRRFQTRH